MTPAPRPRPEVGFILNFHGFEVPGPAPYPDPTASSLVIAQPGPGPRPPPLSIRESRVTPGIGPEPQNCTPRRQLQASNHRDVFLSFSCSFSFSFIWVFVILFISGFCECIHHVHFWVLFYTGFYFVLLSFLPLFLTSVLRLGCSSFVLQPLFLSLYPSLLYLFFSI